MSHLSAERLAALADAPPTTGEEAAHLAACADCAAEREAHRRLAAMALDERTRLAPPLSEWSSLRAALRAEGLVESGSGRWGVGSGPRASAERGRREPSARSRDPLLSRRAGLRVAAALLVAAGGAALGRASAGVPAVPGFTVATATASTSPSGVADTMRSVADASATLVADTTAAAFRSTTEALVALARAEEQYQLAAAFLLQHDSSSGVSGERTRSTGGDASSVYRTRLAALDNVMAASREALYEAPHDPVINRYYLATLGAREATLRQLNTSLPAGARLTRF